MTFGNCCGRWIGTEIPPIDAEALMRSRYTAFVLEHEAYLLHTWQAAHRPPAIAFEPGVKWLGLEVRAHRLLDETHAEVEFVARQKPAQGPAFRLHERSRFVKEGAQWRYTDGDML